MRQTRWNQRQFSTWIEDVVELKYLQKYFCEQFVKQQYAESVLDHVNTFSSIWHQETQYSLDEVDT